jgi:hypothetical protein
MHRLVAVQHPASMASRKIEEATVLNALMGLTRRSSATAGERCFAAELNVEFIKNWTSERPAVGCSDWLGIVIFLAAAFCFKSSPR